MAQDYLDPQALSPIPTGALPQQPQVPVPAPTPMQAAGASPAPNPAPPDPGLFEQLREGWKGAIARLQQDQGAQQALLRFGTSLMQPIQPTQTVAGHFGQATNVGADALLAQRARAQETALTNRREDRADRELKQRETLQENQLTSAEQRQLRELEARERMLGSQLSAEDRRQLRDLRSRASLQREAQQFEGGQRRADRAVTTRGQDIEAGLSRERIGLEARRLGIEESRLEEGMRQFNLTLGQNQQKLAEDRRQFDATMDLQGRLAQIEQQIADAKSAAASSDLPDDMILANSMAKVFLDSGRFTDPNEAYLEAMDIVTGTGRMSPDTLLSKAVIELLPVLQLEAMNKGESFDAVDATQRITDLLRTQFQSLGQTGLRGRGQGAPGGVDLGGAQGGQERMPANLVSQLPQGYTPLHRKDRAGNWLVTDPQGKERAVRGQ